MIDVHTLAVTDSVAVTRVPNLPAVASRVNNQDRVSGSGSLTVPRSVHPGGVVMVTLRLAVTTMSSRSPARTADGTRTPGTFTFEFSTAAPTNTTGLTGSTPPELLNGPVTSNVTPMPCP